MLPAEIRDSIDFIGNDRVSGATSLVLRGIEVLRGVVADKRALLRDAARGLCEAQPSMAGFRTIAGITLAAGDPAAALGELTERIQRAPAAIARSVVPALRLRPPGRRDVRIVTCSRSATVEHTLKTLAAIERTHVACAESRPGREGLDLAEALVAAGADVDVYSDAAIGTATVDADAVVVGADAISAATFINKAGTGGLAAIARAHGCAVIVLASRDKILPAPVFAHLAIDGRSSERDESRRLSVHDRLFERVPLGLVTQVGTDAGLLPADQVEMAGIWTSSALAAYMSLYT